jgi:antitoxin MazE
MKTKVINIGNSKGIRIPKAILQQARLENEVILEVSTNGLLIKPEKQKHKAREGWEQQFKQAVKESKSENLWGNTSNDFDKEDWTWS